MPGDMDGDGYNELVLGDPERFGRDPWEPQPVVGFLDYRRVVTEKRTPILSVECKTSDEQPSKHLRYFRQRFPACDAWQIAVDGKQDYITADGLRVAPALTLLKTLV